LIVIARAEASVLPAVDADIGTDLITLADAMPPRFERGPIHCHSTADNSHKSPTGHEPQKCLFYMPSAKGRAVAVDPSAGGRKRRIHHDGVITLFGRKQIIEPLGIECGWPKALHREQLPPARVDFIGVHLRTG
jgi:hypothetical protein